MILLSDFERARIESLTWFDIWTGTSRSSGGSGFIKYKYINRQPFKKKPSKMGMSVFVKQHHGIYFGWSLGI